MKLVFEDGELERIEKCYEEIKAERGGGAMLFDDDQERVYGLTFKVRNPALAECILGGLLYNRLDDIDMGIELQSINFKPLGDRDELATQLYKAIDQILGVDRYHIH